MIFTLYLRKGNAFTTHNTKPSNVEGLMYCVCDLSGYVIRSMRVC